MLHWKYFEANRIGLLQWFAAWLLRCHIYSETLLWCGQMPWLGLACACVSQAALPLRRQIQQLLGAFRHPEIRLWRFGLVFIIEKDWAQQIVPEFDCVRTNPIEYCWSPKSSLKASLKFFRIHESPCWEARFTLLKHTHLGFTIFLWSWMKLKHLGFIKLLSVVHESHAWKCSGFTIPQFVCVWAFAFGKVKQWCSLAKSIRNTIPITLAASNSCNVVWNPGKWVLKPLLRTGDSFLL